MRNRFANDCIGCSTHVDVEEGHVINEEGVWETYCNSCFDEIEPAICITMHTDGRAKVKPDTHLGDVLFQEYRMACDEAGTKFSSAFKANMASLESLPRLIEELKDRNFLVSVTDEVVNALRDFATAARAASESASTRVESVNAELAKRGEALFGFQEAGVNWLAPRQAALLQDDMGLGKTVQALVSIPEDAPILVVGPAIAKGVWLREGKRWRPDLAGETLKGRTSFRWPKAGEMVITNYDILPDLEKDSVRREVAKNCPDGCVLIADEAQALKNNKAKRTKRFRSLSKYARSKGGKVWLLTATPLLNKPIDLWNILQAADLATEAFSNWETFVDLFGGEKGKWGGYEWGKPSRQVATRLQRVALRREKRDVLPDLPAKIYATEKVEIDKKTKTLCSKVLEAIKAAGLDLDAAVKSANDAALRGIAFEEMSATRAALATAKIPHLLKIAEQYEENETPLVVFSAHRAPIDIFAGREGWAVITGSTSPANRTKIEDDFQAGKLLGVAATIQAGGTAITLTYANNMVFVDKDWTPALNSQAEDRCCRIGQDRGVQVISLVADHPLDESVHELLATKQAIITGSIEASRRTDGLPTDDRTARLEAASSSIADLASDAATDLAARDAAAEEARARRAESRATRPNPTGPASRREAGNGAERWARAALGALAAMDEGEGFSRRDQAFGTSLAAQVAASAGLTDKQWRAAIKLCGRYEGQVGNGPDPRLDTTAIETPAEVPF